MNSAEHQCCIGLQFFAAWQLHCKLRQCIFLGFATFENITHSIRSPARESVLPTSLFRQHRAFLSLQLKKRLLEPPGLVQWPSAGLE